MTEFNELEDRLRAYGRHPVDPPVQMQHLSALLEVPAARSSRIAHKVRVAAALVAGFFIGSTGLAFAGALPAPIQDAASDALSRVGIDSVPVGTERFQGDGTEDCDGRTWKNHGQYVRSQPADQREAASQSRCGKPLVAGAGDGDADVESDDTTKENNGRGSEGRETNACATDGQNTAAAAQERAGEGNKGKPSHAGKPTTTGKPACTPDAANDAGNDAGSDPAGESEDAPDASSTPTEPESNPVDETPTGPPAETDADAGATNGVKDETPAADAGPPATNPATESVPEPAGVPEEAPAE